MPIVEGGTRLLNSVSILTDQLRLRSGMTYADLGIGSSMHFIFPAAKILGEDGKAYAVDIQKGLLEAVVSRSRSEGITNIEPVWSDLEVYGAAKDIANDSLDGLSLINILYQTKEDEHVINEANRMLKPGGRAVVIDWLPSGATFGPPQEKRTSLDKVRQMAKLVKWKEVAAFEPGPYHFGVTFEK